MIYKIKWYCFSIVGTKKERDINKPHSLNSVRWRNNLSPTDLDHSFTEGNVFGLSPLHQFTLCKNIFILTILFKLPVIFKQIRESMKSMYSHSPDDAIFLLNKWDALVLKHQKTDFFEKRKRSYVTHGRKQRQTT